MNCCEITLNVRRVIIIRKSLTPNKSPLHIINKEEINNSYKHLASIKSTATITATPAATKNKIPSNQSNHFNQVTIFTKSIQMTNSISIPFLIHKTSKKNKKNNLKFVSQLIKVTHHTHYKTLHQSHKNISVSVMMKTVNTSNNNKKYKIDHPLVTLHQLPNFQQFALVFKKPIQYKTLLGDKYNKEYSENTQLIDNS